MHRNSKLPRLVIRLGLPALLLILLLIGTNAAQSQSTGTLIGSNQGQLVVIDPTTGSTTTRGTPLSNNFSLHAGVGALDSTNHRYFLQGTEWDATGNNYVADRLFVIDTQTGNVLASPTLNRIVSNLQFESSTGTLIGSNQGQLVVIDPTTGSTTTRGTPLSNNFSLHAGVGALDSTNHRYFLQGTEWDATGNNYVADRLFVIDTQTGNVLASPTLNRIVSNLQFESSTGTLIGSNQGQLVVIDPTTGSTTTRGTPLSNNFSLHAGVGALDSTNHRYFLQGTEWDATGNNYVADRLFVIDTQTGNVLASPTLNRIVSNLQFESSTESNGNTPVGNDVTVSPGAGTSVTFDQVLSSGNTVVNVSSTGVAPPTGFSLGDPPSYYDISTTATYNSPILICITYDSGQYGDPNNLHLLHFENNDWVDTTSSNDTNNHIICGQANSLSPFVVAQRNFTFLGFFKPVDNPPIINVAKAGQAIPIKWSLKDANGNFISDLAMVEGYEYLPTECEAGFANKIKAHKRARKDNLRYDQKENQFVLISTTKKEWKGSCKMFILTLTDGTTHQAKFKFK